MSPESGAAAPNDVFTELRSGLLGVRLASGEAEIDAVQALRYRVFYQEMGARADERNAPDPARP